MNLPLDSLQRDYATLTEILQSHRGVATETMQVGVLLLWRIYLAMLEDALTTISSLISYLNRDTSS